MLMHFESLLSFIGADADKIDMGRFRHMIRSLIDPDDFDEAWYLKTYPDVRVAVNKRVYESGWSHYCTDGYFQGRLPSLKKFNADEYIEKYPDIVAFAAGGDKKSKAEEHFIAFGYKESRERTPEERHMIALNKQERARKGWFKR